MDKEKRHVMAMAEARIKSKSGDHLQTLIYVDHRSAEGRRLRRIYATIATTCVSLGLIMDQEGGALPYMLRVGAVAATVLWSMRELSDVLCRRGLRSLSETHPLRLQMILDEIGEKIPRLREDANKAHQEFLNNQS